MKTENAIKENGFTLIEILVALFLFSIVITIVFASFKELAYSATRVGESGAAYDMVNPCLLRVTTDLESVFVHQRPGYVEPDFNSDPDPFRVEGSGETVGDSIYPVIRFASLAHLAIDRDTRQGISEIVYYVDDNDGELVLRRSDRIGFQEEFEKKKSHPVICRKIKKMTVAYFDASGESHDDWDSESDEYGYATPSHIEITIESGGKDHSVVFGTKISLRSVRDEKEEK